MYVCANIIIHNMYGVPPSMEHIKCGWVLRLSQIDCQRPPNPITLLHLPHVTVYLQYSYKCEQVPAVEVIVCLYLCPSTQEEMTVFQTP